MDDDAEVSRLRAAIVWASTSKVFGWVGPSVIATVAFLLRLWRLEQPRRFVFDETYYAKDAFSLWHGGYPRAFIPDADVMIGSGVAPPGILQDKVTMIMHPEVGKWMIAAGEATFGMTPFGWRISSVVAGSLLVLVVARIARRLTSSNWMACVAALLLCLDGLHFTMSRLALLDIFLVLFLSCAVACVLADRDWVTARLDQGTDQGSDGPTGWSPFMLWRPWLTTAGVCFGLAVGTKWLALYPLVAFGLIVWFTGWRRRKGIHNAFLKSIIADGLPAFGHLVVVGFVVYLASWTGWLMNADKAERDLGKNDMRQFASTDGTCKKDGSIQASYDRAKAWPTSTEPDATGLGELAQSLRSLYYHHQDVWTFHSTYLNCGKHIYGAKPAGWLIMQHPANVHNERSIAPGTKGCPDDAPKPCSRHIILLGNPALWWTGCVALAASLVAFVMRRQWADGVVLTGLATTWLPWFQYTDRDLFGFYALATLPFIVLAVCLAMHRLLQWKKHQRNHRVVTRAVAMVFLLLVIDQAVFFWPVWSDRVITESQWQDRLWLAGWKP